MNGKALEYLTRIIDVSGILQFMMTERPGKAPTRYVASVGYPHCLQQLTGPEGKSRPTLVQTCQYPERFNSENQWHGTTYVRRST